MSQECRNDCVEQFLFPKELNNRAGLSHIDYRIGTYSDFREALLRKLNASPILSSWTHREPDDPGIALLESASIVADILTFYQELYANEAYLRTAQWRESIADLVKLLGYRLSPGVGGKGVFAFEVKGDKPVVIPAGFPVKAQLEGGEGIANFESKEEVVAYPQLSKFHLYCPLCPPEEDEVPNEFYISSPNQYTSPITLEKGDRILIGDLYSQSNGPGLVNSEIVIVDEIRTLHGQKLFKIKGKLQNSPSGRTTVKGYKIGRSFRHFGHNAPRKIVTTNFFGDVGEETISYRRAIDKETSTSKLDLHNVDYSEKQIVCPALSHLDFALDNKIDNLPNGNQIIISCTLYGIRYFPTELIGPKEFTFVRTIKNIKSRSMSWGAMSGSTTIISFAENESLMTIENSDGSTYIYNTMDIRMVDFHEVVSPLIKMRAKMQETTLTKGRELNFYGTNDEANILKGKKLLFKKTEEGSFSKRVSAVESRGWDVIDQPLIRRIIVTLDEEVNYADFPNKDPQVTVYGNLVEANQGKTENEAVLGNGDSRQTFQTFKIPKAPLTYHIVTDETPPEVAELQVYVNDRLWTRVPSFFGHGPKEEVYIVREDTDNNSWIQFGDGKTGARLPSGMRNVVAKYRSGIGAYGPLKEETTVQPGGNINRLRKIYLPGVVTGGSEPEDGDIAREAAPGKIQSLGRLVSLKDYEIEALAIAGVEKVSANWRLENNIPTVVITALMESGREKEGKDLQDNLNSYNKDRGPDRFPISVHLARRQYVYLTLIVGFDPSYEQKQVKKTIKKVLGVTGEEDKGIDGSKGLFGDKQRRFGQREYASRIEGVVQNVKGVIWAKVDKLGFVVGESDDPHELTKPESLQYHAVIPGLLSMVKSLNVMEQPPSYLRYNEVEHGKWTKEPQPEAEDTLFCLHITHLDVIPGTVNATEVR